MYKRLELHNHTTESDSSLTIEALANHMAKDQVDAFALTDHNTISGHPKMKKFLDENNIHLSCIYGMEYTTYYGHILCLNLKEYVPWENINLHKPELLFRAVQEKGALAGVAHPFSYGYPIGTCRFEMTFTDYSCIDFIEIFNNPEPLHEVNELGLLWWEDLILEGHRIAFTCGMDLHGQWDMSNQFATFIEGSTDGNIEKELTDAISTQQTWISKGPLLKADVDPLKKEITFSIIESGKPGYTEYQELPYTLSLRTKKGTSVIPFDNKVPLIVSCVDFDSSSPIISKLYHGKDEIENLVCVAPVIYL